MLLFVVDILNEEATMLIPNDLTKTVAEKSFGATVTGDTRRAARRHEPQETDHPEPETLTARPASLVPKYPRRRLPHPPHALRRSAA